MDWRIIVAMIAVLAFDAYLSYMLFYVGRSWLRDFIAWKRLPKK